jgi:4-hydroxyphenylpyruvate dioxygenase-like putative hemolysin
MLSEITGTSSSALSRRCDAVRLKVKENVDARNLAADIIKDYQSRND